jgi:FMN phosphatase YigB (HAD superfamily)
MSRVNVPADNQDHETTALTRILDRFPVVLLDANGTFMFGEDRFGPDQDFYASYRVAGGGFLSEEAVSSAVRACHRAMMDVYEDPMRVDDFPSVATTLHNLPETANFPAKDRALLERVIALHELGTVPEAYAAALRRLRAKHRLGLVTNIWSRKEPWLNELARVGIDKLFEAMVFSSDTASVKPSRHLFELATRAFDVPRSAMVFIGDSWSRDIVPAARAGLATVWISRDASAPPQREPSPDLVVADLLALLELGPASTVV